MSEDITMSEDTTVSEDDQRQNDQRQDLVAVIALPPGYTIAKYLLEARTRIARYVVKAKRYNGNPPPPHEAREVEGHLTFIHAFLPWLETSVVMNHKLRNESKIDQALEHLFDPQRKVPGDIADTARRIYEKFQEEDWGGDDTSETEDSAPTTPTLPSSIPTRRTAGAEDMYEMARAPPPGHPIWGIGGIMHGFLNQPSPSKRHNPQPDPRYMSEKRSAKVFGHNGFEPGDWWPYQRVAHFRGAHGAPVAGISGDKDLGAWSVVMNGSSKYEELDKDLGDTIWYSSDKSHENVDPTRIHTRSNMTLSLHRSIANGNPVRVLRSRGSGSSSGAYSPVCGIRYDGLYTVDKVVERKNHKGGLYEQFKLVRRDGQKSLDEICRTSPTRQQVSDFNRIQELY